jgi:hypothetical protein
MACPTSRRAQAQGSCTLLARQASVRVALHTVTPLLRAGPVTHACNFKVMVKMLPPRKEHGKHRSLLYLCVSQWQSRNSVGEQGRWCLRRDSELERQDERKRKGEEISFGTRTRAELLALPLQALGVKHNRFRITARVAPGQCHCQCTQRAPGILFLRFPLFPRPFLSVQGNLLRECDLPVFGRF